MSLDKNRREAERWFQTASEDLYAAQVLRDNGVYAQACFLSQQCAEKSLKAMWFLHEFRTRLFIPTSARRE